MLMPVMALSGSSAPVSEIPNSVVATSPSTYSQKLNTQTFSALAFNQALTLKVDEDKKAAETEAKILKAKGDAIDAYFKDRGMPLFGTGLKMATEAEKNGLDWRLVAAISVRESTGGKFECVRVPNNAFGWGSCKIGFKSNDEAIETVARNLGGNNPRTAYHYSNKTTMGILRAYNPPSIVPLYAEQVVSIMDAISSEEVDLDISA